MQKIKVIGLLGLLVFLLLHQSCQAHKKSAPKGSTKNVESFYCNHPIIIDANLNEKGWKDAPSISFEDDSLRTDTKMTVSTLWDFQNLYIAFEVKDKNLQSRQTILDHPQLSRDDIVEFLIDAQNDKDSCWSTDDIIYHINLLGQKKDDRGTMACKSDSKWNGNAKSAVQLFGSLNNSSDVDTGYIVEIAIPWQEIEVVPAVDFRIGINFAGADSGIFFDWAGAWPFRSPYAFGDLVLKRNNNYK